MFLQHEIIVKTRKKVYYSSPIITQCPLHLKKQTPIHPTKKSPNQTKTKNLHGQLFGIPETAGICKIHFEGKKDPGFHTKIFLQVMTLRANIFVALDKVPAIFVNKSYIKKKTPTHIKTSNVCKQNWKELKNSYLLERGGGQDDRLWKFLLYW